MEIGGVEHGWTDGGFERRNRQAEAQLTLAFVKRHDRIVEGYHQLTGRQDLSRADIDAWRERRRGEYRRATGVEIEQRDELKQNLQRVIATGDRSVAEVVDELRTRYANGGSWGDVTFAVRGEEFSGTCSTV